jgi:heme/copper-type cytochrome/quinol oxidase subunit 4
MKDEEDTGMKILGCMTTVAVIVICVALSWFIFRAKHPDAAWWTFFF